MKQIYFPLTDYKQEYRYSYYLCFLIRVIFKDVRYTKILRKDFINEWYKQGFWTRRHLTNVWNKWAYTNEFFNVISRARNCLSLVWKKKFELVLVPAMIYNKIKTITDFKIFITCCFAWKESKDSKGRGYNNIASRIWTHYKETACNRVKKGIEKFWLEKKNRYCNYNWHLARLTNTYNFWGVTYIKNNQNSVTNRATNRLKPKGSNHLLESIWGNIIKGQFKNLPYLPTNMYSLFNPKIYV